MLLNVQLHDLEDQPHEREVTRRWAHHIEEARQRGELIVIVQWDGEADSDHATFSRGWILHPDFRAEAGDLLIRAVKPDVFASSDLDAELKARAVREIRLLALPDAQEAEVTARCAAALGYRVKAVESAGVA